MTSPKSWDFVEFDKQWLELGKEICLTVYNNPRVAEIKKSLQKNGFLTLEEKSEFINISDRIKYEVIYCKFGPEGSEGYKDFSEAWKNWFQKKGVESSHNRGQRNSVEHILFGSTPDPVQFLNNFEQEVLNKNN
jgi:hypothetical protein